MTDAPLTIATASVFLHNKVIIELSDGRAIVLTLEQLLQLKPETTLTEEEQPQLL